jgi:hypothetical protein
MENILFMDFELNKPLTYLDKFNQLLKKDGWILDMFWVKDYSQEKKPSLDDKINNSDLLFIRKPLTFLSSPTATEKIQNAILKNNKNLLLMMTYSDYETFDMLKNFLIPFNITLSEFRAFDIKTYQEHERSVIFHKKNKCFNHKELFKGINKVLIPDASHLVVEPPANVLIRGNPSTETSKSFGGREEGPKGSDIIVGAYYEESGKILVVNSTVFLDNFFDFNKPFIKNIMGWLDSNNPKKKK